MRGPGVGGVGSQAGLGTSQARHQGQSQAQTAGISALPASLCRHRRGVGLREGLGGQRDPPHLRQAQPRGSRDAAKPGLATTAGGPGPFPGLTLQRTWHRDTGFRAADGGWDRGEGGVMMRRVQRGRRDADGAEDAGPGMQRGFKSADGDEEADDGDEGQGRRRDLGAGGGGQGQGQRQDLGVLAGEQTGTQGRFKGAGKDTGAEARGLNGVLGGVRQRRGYRGGNQGQGQREGCGVRWGRRAGTRRSGAERGSGAGDSPRTSWARARHTGAKWTQCPHQEAKNSTAQALGEPSSRSSAPGPSSSSGSLGE